MRITSIVLLMALGGGDPAATVESLRWMAGSWVAHGTGAYTEELWMEPAGGMMLGLNRTVREGKTSSFEFLRIEEREGGIVYLASPGGAKPTPFSMTEVKGDRAVFENPAHDFPQRIVYWRRGADLCARIESLRGEGQEWCWKPAR